MGRKLIEIMDTTLRDGEQTPGVSLSPEKKLSIAKKLSENGAELAFTYLGDTLKKRVIPLAESLKSNLIFLVVGCVFN